MNNRPEYVKGNLSDGMKESSNDVTDLTGGMSSKVLGILILIIVLAAVLGWLIFK